MKFLSRLLPYLRNRRENEQATFSALHIAQTRLRSWGLDLKEDPAKCRVFFYCLQASKRITISDVAHSRFK